MVRLEGRGTALLSRLAPGDKPQWWGLVGAREVASDNGVGGWEVGMGGGRGGEVRYLPCHVMQVGQGGSLSRRAVTAEMPLWSGRVEEGDWFGWEGLTMVQSAVLWCQCGATVHQFAVLFLGGGGDEGVVDVSVMDGGWGGAE